jgi:hypothetical protein
MGGNGSGDEIIVRRVKEDHSRNNLPPGDWWNSIRIRTTSPGRSVLDQQFVYRVVFSVRRLEFASTCCPPGGLVHGKVPLRNTRIGSPGGTCDAISHGTAIWPFDVSSPLKPAVFISFPTLLVSSHVPG